MMFNYKNDDIPINIYSDFSGNMFVKYSEYSKTTENTKQQFICWCKVNNINPLLND